MKKALCDLQFIIVDLDRCILKYDKTIMPKKDLIRVRVLKHLRNDLFETITVYKPELNNF
ncbi:hypothetical protein ES708_07243 [subsurface metagenome]